MIRAIHLLTTAVCLCAAGTLALPIPVRAQSPIDAFVTKVADGIAGVHKQAGGDATKTRDGCADFLGSVLDLPAMAKVASRERWEQMSAEQRTGYEKAFTHRLAGECAWELVKYNGEAITLAGVRTMANGDKLATIRLGPPEKARMIAWQLHGTDDPLSAVDVVFEGHSVMIKAHDDFLKVLRANRGNIDAVIESLRK